MIAGSFWDIFRDSDTLIPIAGMMIPVVAIIAGVWYRIESVRARDALKQTLAERGYSADEIVRIVESKPRSGRDEPSSAPPADRNVDRAR